MVEDTPDSHVVFNREAEIKSSVFVKNFVKHCCNFRFDP